MSFSDQIVFVVVVVVVVVVVLVVVVLVVVVAVVVVVVGVGVVVVGTLSLQFHLLFQNYLANFMKTRLGPKLGWWSNFQKGT